MPFELKNVEATYQRIMIKMFRDKIGDMVEVYINDMVIKSWESQRHIDDLMGVFEMLRQHRLCLNADVCVFGVGVGKFLGYMIIGVGKFLGYMIIHRRIEVNLDQISAIDQLKPLSNPKYV